MTRSSFSRVLEVALAAVASRRARRKNIGVIWRVLVSARTMGLCTLTGRCYSAIRRTVQVSSPQVLGARDWFKVVWVDTVTNTAKMIKIKPIGDGANERFIGESVGDGTLSSHSHEGSIATVCLSADPEPTSVRMLLNMTPEPNLWINRLGTPLTHA